MSDVSSVGLTNFLLTTKCTVLPFDVLKNCTAVLVLDGGKSLSSSIPADVYWFPVAFCT